MTPRYRVTLTKDARNSSPRNSIPLLNEYKKWLFSNTVSGAHASSILYSFIETAKANGLIPFNYLHHVLEVLSHKVDEENLNALLPWNVSLQLS